MVAQKRSWIFERKPGPRRGRDVFERQMAYGESFFISRFHPVFLADKIRAMQKIKLWIDKYCNVAFFAVGFLFDTFTMVRIDSSIDLIFQAVYLGMITLMLIVQTKVDAGVYRRRPLAKIMALRIRGNSFFYGGLLMRA